MKKKIYLTIVFIVFFVLIIIIISETREKSSNLVALCISNDSLQICLMESAKFIYNVKVVSIGKDTLGLTIYTTPIFYPIGKATMCQSIPLPHGIQNIRVEKHNYQAKHINICR